VRRVILLLVILGAAIVIGGITALVFGIANNIDAWW
jgi:hypothetical protein